MYEYNILWGFHRKNVSDFDREHMLCGLHELISSLLMWKHVSICLHPYWHTLVLQKQCLWSNRTSSSNLIPIETNQWTFAEAETNIFQPLALWQFLAITYDQQIGVDFLNPHQVLLAFDQRTSVSFNPNNPVPPKRCVQLNSTVSFRW